MKPKPEIEKARIYYYLNSKLVRPILIFDPQVSIIPRKGERVVWTDQEVRRFKVKEVNHLISEEEGIQTSMIYVYLKEVHR